LRKANALVAERIDLRPKTLGQQLGGQVCREGQRGGSQHWRLICQRCVEAECGDLNETFHNIRCARELTWCWNGHLKGAAERNTAGHQRQMKKEEAAHWRLLI
jgi:hypothetical protein